MTLPQPVASGDLSGQWVSTNDGVETQATLQQAGTTLSGTFSESGMTLPFQATLTGTPGMARSPSKVSRSRSP